MEKQYLKKSELVLNPDMSIYHLHLKPDQIADTIFLVGDPGRVETMSALFDSVDHRVENREFVTHTGTYKGKGVTVLSTGIGTDNIDIVVNELDALANINFSTREVNPEIKSLNLIRIGTSGALHADIDPGSIIISDISCGLDNLMHYYRELPNISEVEMGENFLHYMKWNPHNSHPYFINCSSALLSLFDNSDYFHGITLSAPGFYAPQGRSLRMEITDKEYIEKISRYRYGNYRINNFEMEGSALYGLSRILGHSALTICVALANRITGRFITEYKPIVQKLLAEVLDVIVENHE